MAAASERRAYDRFGTYETTDDTPTLTEVIQLETDYSGYITAYITAQKHDSAGSFAYGAVSCYVETDGTVTANAPYDGISGGSGSTLNITWVATGVNAVAVQITGNDSETWGWTVHVEGQAQAYTVTPFGPDSFPNLRLWFDPDQGLTESSGDVSAWVNQGSVGGTATPFNNDPTLVSGLYITNREGVHIDETQALVSSTAVSDLRFLHDGTGCTLYALVDIDASSTDATNVVLDTNGSNASSIGFFLSHDGASNRYIFRIGNGSGSYLINTSSPGNSIVSGYTYLLTIRHKAGETNEWEFYLNGALIGSGAYTGSASTSDPTYSLTMGGRASAPDTLGLDGSIIQLLAYADYHDAATMAQVADLLWEGTTPPVAFGNAKLWLDANDLSLGTGNVTWADRTVNGNDGTLVGSPNVSDGYGTGSHRMVTLDGSTQYITADGVGSVAAGTDTHVSVVMVCRLHTNAAAYNSYFAFDQNSSAIPLLEVYKQNNVSGVLIAIKRDDANSLASVSGSATNTSGLVLVYSHPGTTVTTWRNGTIDLNAAALDRGAMTTDNFSVGVVRRGGTPASYAPLEVCEVIVWDKALSSAEAAAEYARLSAKWA